MHDLRLVSLLASGPPEQDSDTGAAPSPATPSPPLRTPLSSCGGNEEDHGHGGRGWTGTGGPLLPHRLPQVCAGQLHSQSYDIICSI